MRQDHPKTVASWAYEGRARGVYTELDNVLTITVRDPAVRVLRLEISDGTRVEREGKTGGLKIEEVPKAEGEAGCGCGTTDRTPVSAIA